ncbi:MAG: type I-C CRISPR-associated endonuclease Cas1 [Chitinivibrionales bacterium]|nr:type I-C CRISPR-associated endonuclease Cas1 [Chitinivibrionales bacterium]
MKKLLNVLYVTSENARVSRERETVVIEAMDKKLGQFPIHMLQGIVTFGPVWVSPFIMELCAEHGVTITHLTMNGAFLARVEGAVSGNILLRKKQYEISLDHVSVLAITKGIVAAKIANSRHVLRRHLRNHAQTEGDNALETSIKKLGSFQEQTGRIDDLNSLRGIEGIAADEYFSCFDAMITCQKEQFFFKGRSRRPPLDMVNCLLSFTYTLLTHDCRAALEGVGLDPQAGFLHTDRPGRPSLALDLVEEFRAILADRLVLSLINLQQVKPTGFKREVSGAVLMDDDTRKTVLSSWQKRKTEELVHPFTEEKVAIGLLFHIQAQLLARAIRGELEFYTPFVAK